MVFNKVPERFGSFLSFTAKSMSLSAPKVPLTAEPKTIAYSIPISFPISSKNLFTYPN